MSDAAKVRSRWLLRGRGAGEIKAYLRILGDERPLSGPLKPQSASESHPSPASSPGSASSNERRVLNGPKTKPVGEGEDSVAVSPSAIVPRDYWEDVDGVRRLWSPDIFYRMYNPGLSVAEKIVLVLKMISRCKVAKSIPSFLPPEYVIAEDEDEEDEGEGARDDHREVEDVMETDNDDQELSSEEGRERERRKVWERERKPEVEEMHGEKRSLIVRGTILRVCSLCLFERPTLGVRRRRHLMSSWTSARKDTTSSPSSLGDLMREFEM